MLRTLLTLVVAVAAVLGWAGTVAPTAALAQDASAEMSLEDALAALSSDDASARDAAIDRLVRAGPRGAAKIVVTADLPRDARAWDGLESALSRWPVGTAADALSELRTSWSVASRRQLDGLVTRLRCAEPVPEFPSLEDSPPDVAAAVRASLAAMEGRSDYSSDEPSVRRIVALGREAVPALVEVLRSRTKGGGWDPVARAGRDALAQLVGPGDVPVLEALLVEGHLVTAARALLEVGTPSADRAIVAAIERGQVSAGLAEVLGAANPDRRVALTLLGWLERHPGETAAGWVATALRAAGLREAVPALSVAVLLQADAYARVKTADALASLGERGGIDVLMADFERSSEPLARDEAGRALNRLAGRRIYVASWDPSESPSAEEMAAFADAFREWASNELAFDEASRTWVVDGRPDSLPESPREVKEAVREILSELDGRRSYSPWSDRSDRLVALGHDAVPELLRMLRDGTRATTMYPRQKTAHQALAKLLTEEDVAVVARLLAAGHTGVAPVLRDLHGDASRDALLGAVEAGHLDHEILEALDRYAGARLVQDALLRWIERFGTSDEWETGMAAQTLGRVGADHGAAGLRDVLPSLRSRGGRSGVAIALARLGEKSAIPVLIDILGASSGCDQAAADVGGELNAMVGRTVFLGAVAPGGGRGNMIAAADELLAWWRENEQLVRFDEATRRWTTTPRDAGFPWPESSPEITNEVGSLLDGLPEGRAYAGRSATGHALIDLGHDAVPAIARYLLSGRARTHRMSLPDRTEVAAEALAGLCTERDVPLLLALVEAGHAEVSRALVQFPGEEVRDAMLAIVRAGGADRETIEALMDHRADTATWDAVGAVIREHDPHRQLAQFLAFEGTEAALPLACAIAEDSDAEPFLRVHALIAMIRNGDTAAIEPLIEYVADDPGSRDGPNSWWTHTVGGLAGRTLNSVLGRRVYPSDDAAEAFSASWQENRERLRFDRARSAFTTVDTMEAQPLVVDPASPAARAVADALRRARQRGAYMSGGLDPAVGELTAIGPAAVPHLIVEVLRALPWEALRSTGGGFDRQLAADALCELLSRDQEGVALALLREGRLGIARYFDEHPSPEGRDTLLDVLRRGFGTDEVFHALEPFAKEPEVRRVMLQWLAREGADVHAATWSVPRMLAKPALDGSYPALVALDDEDIPRDVRALLAVELVRAGAKDAIPALIEFFAAPRGLSAQDEWRVASCLNETAGRAIAAVTENMPVAISGLPPELADDDGPAVDAAREEAAAAFREWWADVAERLSFDAGSGEWGVGPR